MVKQYVTENNKRFTCPSGMVSPFGLNALVEITVNKFEPSPVKKGLYSILHSPHKVAYVKTLLLFNFVRVQESLKQKIQSTVT